ncbi:MAG TPA: methyltransferase domain-containing protein [Methanobacteriaceae archaeon]|nr:methyltransferase domain-containing protein [Methanobacteriaceae archaeon]
MSEKNVKFWRDVSDKYDNAIDIILGKNIRHYILENLEQESNLGRSVEFGCGTGYFTKALAEKSETLIATDISNEMLEIAENNLDKIKNTEFKCLDCQSSSFGENTFDTVFIGLVLLFTDDAQKVLEESKRILKPEGSLLLAEPDISYLSGYGKLKFFYRTITSYWKIPPTGHFFTQEELLRMLNETDFKVIQKEVLQDPSDPHSLSASYIKSISV